MSAQTITLTQITTAAGIATAIAGGVTLADRALGAFLRNSQLPEIGTMKVDTALGFVLVGGALWLAQTIRTSRHRVWLIALLGGSVVLLGSRALASDAGWNFLAGQVQLIAGKPLPPSSEPGQMAVATAFNFTLIGCALVALTAGGRRARTVSGLSLLTMLIALLALVGYLYGAPAFYRPLGTAAVMTPPTAVLFFVVATGIVVAQPNAPIVSQLLADDPGGILARTLLPAVILLPVAVGFAALAGMRAGLYASGQALALSAVASVIVFAILIWITAGSMSRSDRQRERSEWQALHDPLTGLPNRLVFHDRLGQALRLGDRNKTAVALLLLDLDGFKRVNDTLGHQAGDLVLQQVAARLSGALRKADTIARLGGDEFAVIGEGASRLPDAVLLAERLLATLDLPLTAEEENIQLGVSIGIALSSTDGADAPMLIRRADQALYAAKRKGDGYAVYGQRELSAA